MGPMFFCCFSFSTATSLDDVLFELGELHPGRIPDLAEFSFELAPQKHQRLQIREEKNYVVFHHASNSHNDRKNQIEAPANLVLFSFTLNSEGQCPLFIR